MTTEGYNEPSQEMRARILSSLWMETKVTFGDLYARQLRGAYSWTELIMAMNQLMLEGLIMREGDGFAVYYSLTDKGKHMIDKIG
jgi:DNA-binding HxlR family transcriptional regulator